MQDGLCQRLRTRTTGTIECCESRYSGNRLREPLFCWHARPMSAVALWAFKGALFLANLRHAVREVENSKGVCLAFPGDLPGQPAGLLQRSGPVHRFDVAPAAFEYNLVSHLAREILSPEPHSRRRPFGHVNTTFRLLTTTTLRLLGIPRDRDAACSGDARRQPPNAASYIYSLLK